MTAAEKLTFAWLDGAHVAGLAQLFADEGSPCYCRYWHFEGDKNGWLARCAESPDTNRAELEADVTNATPRANGIVAIDATGRVVGWMKLAPRATLPKLRKLPTYRAHDLGPDEGVWSIGCFLVRESERRHGVARALVGAGVRMAKEKDARAIEAYPREGLHPYEAWTGPATIFDGFEMVAGEHPYPVLRRAL